ncbi:MarR family winged helix-turn-helix transcriptional regulator [Xanthobacter aminoxidans]|uniref:MarR family winged helix-turn-helix transcriptional regulator n=1 Tax=Xanthobacter aminoxidans TaxID=186280 RepID=UPI003729B8B5
MRTDRGTGIDQCNCNALRKAARRVTHYYDTCLAPSGLRVTQFAILALLHERKNLSVGDLADALDLDRTTAGKNLRPLERAGLIQVAVDEMDARSRRVDLTQKGATALAAATPLWQAAQMHFERKIGPSAAADLRRTLAGIVI